MYATMGLASPPQVAKSETEFVDAAVAVACNGTLRRELVDAIAARSDSLFGREDVVEEWAEFLLFARAAPRPKRVRWWRALAPLRARALFGPTPVAALTRAALALAVDRAAALNDAALPLVTKRDERVSFFLLLSPPTHTQLPKCTPSPPIAHTFVFMNYGGRGRLPMPNAKFFFPT